MPDHTRRRHAQVTWNFERLGSYGTFATAGSLPIEYVLTSFRPNDLANLSFARDIKPNTLDFDQLMQRDLDEERTVTALGKYLNPNPQHIVRRLEIVFFPPLLIACIPADDGTIVDRYPDEEWDDKEKDKLNRTWEGLVRLEFFKAPGSDPGAVIVRCTNDDRIQLVDPTNVNARFQLAAGKAPGAKLVAIDGQHRLLALKKLAEKSQEAIENLSVPVCILFATSTSKAFAAENKIGNAGTPNVPGVFRKVFVDVNSKIEKVGAHFTILLNDSDVGSLIVRRFCDYVIEKSPYSLKTLSLVEWNVKSEKDATVLTRDYSITSIGVIHKGLKENFSRNIAGLFDRLINIEAADVREQLKKAADPEAESAKVAWDKFSVAQRSIIEKQIRLGIVPLLYDLFLGVDASVRAVEAHVKELGRLEKESRENSLDAEHCAAAYDAIINCKPIPDRDMKVKSIVKQLGVGEQKARTADNFGVFRYALFQRALFSSLKEIMLSQPDLPLVAAGAILLALVNRALDKKVNLFGFEKRYTTYTIWSGLDVIAVRASTRLQFARLLLGMLGSEPFARAVVKGMGLVGNAEDAIRRLVALGNKQAGEYISAYAQDAENQFAKAYQTNLALTDDQIAVLKQAEEQEEKEKQDIREGKLEAKRAVRQFRTVVREHLQDEFAAAEEQLKDTLGFEVHRVETDGEGEADSLDE